MKGNMKPIEQWRKLLRECVARRIEVEAFRKLVKILTRRAPLPQASLVDVLFDSRSVTADIFPYDPLIPRYANALRRLGLVRTSILLDGLRKHSFIGSQPQSTSTTDHDKPADQEKAARRSTLMTDTRIVQDVINSLTSTTVSLSTYEVNSIFTVTAEWILAVVRWHTSNISNDHQSGGLLSSSDALALFESLGILVVALSTTEKGLEALSSEGTQGRGETCFRATDDPMLTHDIAFKIPLGQALTAYLSSSATISLNLRNRLDSLQKGYQLYGEPAPKDIDVQMIDGMNMNALQFEASVLDGPVINSRAGLYIYINALVSTLHSDK